MLRLNGAIDLVFERLRTPVPELSKVQRRIEDSRRIDGSLAALNSRGDDRAVVASPRQVVTAGTRHLVVG